MGRGWGIPSIVQLLELVAWFLSRKAHLFLHSLLCHVSNSKRASTEICFHFLLPLTTLSIWGSAHQWSSLSSGSIGTQSKTNFSKRVVGQWPLSLGSRYQAGCPNCSMALIQQHWQGRLGLCWLHSLPQKHNRYLFCGKQLFAFQVARYLYRHYECHLISKATLLLKMGHKQIQALVS